MYERSVTGLSLVFARCMGLVSIEAQTDQLLWHNGIVQHEGQKTRPTIYFVFIV